MKKIALTKDFLNSNKILFSFGEILKDYYSGKRDFNPVSIEIHPTARCNHRCIHCSYTERNQVRTSLDKQVMDKLISSIIQMGIKSVYFSGGGEPTFYPDLKKYIEELYNNNVEVALITNGSYLNESGIISNAYMFNYIAISIPSVDDNIFFDITGTRNLKKILDVPSEIKRLHSERAPIIGARVIITSKMYKEVLTILEVLKNRGYDYVLFKIVRDYESKGTGMTEKEEAELKSIIGTIPCIDNNYTNLNSLFSFKAQPTVNNCIVNDTGLIANVDTDGKVYPNIVEIGHDDFCIGDLKETSLHEIWNSEQHQRVKTASREKSSKGLCSKNCRAISYNHIIQNMIDVLPSSVDNFI